MAARRFPASVVRAVGATKYFGIRVGDGDHRFIGIWMVALDGRLFVRSWTMKARGWYRALDRAPYGVVQVGAKELRFRARRVTGDRLKDAVSDAYFAKYDTPASLEYCRGFARGRRRDSTTELLPR